MLFRSRIAPLAAAVLLLAAAGAARTEEAPRAEEAETPAVLHRPSWGRVIGWVLDAGTRLPVPGARVAVEVDGAFPEEGKATATTDARGRFEARAPLGKITSRLDWGRILTMSPLSLLLSPRSATQQTRILDVLQANVRIEAKGYRRFVGRVRARILDANRFAITLEDVWLAAEGSGLASFTPEGLRLERIESFRVEPEVAAPGERVRVTLVARLPVERGERYRAYVTSSAPRLAPAQLELKPETRREGAGAGEPGRVVFSREFRLPARGLDRWAELGCFLVWEGRLRLTPTGAKALLQRIAAPEERPAAEAVAQGHAAAQAGRFEAALAAYARARRLRPEYPLGPLFYGDLCLDLDRPHEAAAAYRELVALAPQDYERARSRYARALVAAGDARAALETLAGAEQAFGRQPLPPAVALARALALAAEGRFDEAEAQLARAGGDPQTGRDPRAGARGLPDDLLAEVHRRRLAQAVRDAPEDVELRMSYARALAGGPPARRRLAEAVAQARAAVALAPSEPWPWLELGEHLWALEQREEALEAFRRAVALAPEHPEPALALAEACRRAGRYAEALPLYERVVAAQPLALGARHGYALMLYAAGRLADARRELLEVVRQARAKGDLHDSGIPFLGPGILGSGLYFGPKRRLAAGFSVPEAAAAVALLEALQELDRHPGSGLLWQNVGHALLELDLPDLALDALRTSLDREPELIETRFLVGVACRKLGQNAGAEEELRAVLRANPLHPRARIELARLYADQGRLDRAQAELLAHQRLYPSAGG